MSVDILPTLPVDPVTRNQTAAAFVSAANAFLGALPAFQVAMNTSIGQFNADFLSFNTTSASTLATNATYAATASAASTSANASKVSAQGFAAAAQAAVGLPALQVGRFLYSPDGASVVWGTQDGTCQYASSDFLLTTGRPHLVNTVSGIVNAITPSNPNADDVFLLSDTGNAGLNKIVVKRGGTNLVTFPEAFDNAAWTKTRSSATANTKTAPDGTLTGDTLTEDTTATSDHYASNTATSLANSAMTISVYAQQGTRTAIELSAPAPFFIDAAVRSASFNLATGAIIATSAGATSRITNVGGGWYRCEMTVIPTIAVTSAVQLRMHNGTTSTYTGTSNTLFLWGAKVEIGTSATFYDPVTASMNMLLYSEQIDNAAWTKSATTVVAGTIVAPDGTASAERVVETATTAAHFVSQAATITAGQYVNVCVFLQAGERNFVQVSIDDGTTNGVFANFNLALGTIDTASAARGTGTVGAAANITYAGAGWYKCCVSGIVSASATSARLQVFPATATGATYAPSYLGDITKGFAMWGAQMCTGTVSTPYVKSVATQATRTAGIATRIMWLQEDMDITTPYAPTKLVYRNEFAGWTISA